MSESDDAGIERLWSNGIWLVFFFVLISIVLFVFEPSFFKDLVAPFWEWLGFHLLFAGLTSLLAVLYQEWLLFLVLALVILYWFIALSGNDPAPAEKKAEKKK